MHGGSDVIHMLVDRRAAATPTATSPRSPATTWQAVDYADGLVRVGVQSAVARPETAALLRTLMTARGMPVPPVNRVIRVDRRRRALRGKNLEEIARAQSSHHDG